MLLEVGAQRPPLGFMFKELIDQMTKPPIVMTAQEAGDRCRQLSYDTQEKGTPLLSSYNWTTPHFVKLLNEKFPSDFVAPVCTGEYIGKWHEGPSNCSGHHHMHGKPDVKLVCCLCGWEWIPNRERLLSQVYTCLVAKLLEDELGF